MNTYRIQSQLSAAVRSQAFLRHQLASSDTSWFAKLVCYIRWFFISLRVRRLIERLHSH
jgi:hypothetical protein